MSAQAVASSASTDVWRDLALWIADATGLHFARARDLRRVFQGAAAELGFSNDIECAHWLMAQSAQALTTAGQGLASGAANRASAATLQVLARHLTVGETYFFRDRAALDALAMNMLVPLIAARRAGRRHLRIWCAACCTGEEAYTVAIMLHRLLPDIAEWDITLAATDLNESFIRRAKAASYGEWSFRDAPSWLRPNYFTEDDAGRYTLRPHIARMVRFSVLNLVGEPDGVPTSLRAMDVVLCRNALMYFSPVQMTNAVDRLTGALVPGGCMVVGPGETPFIVHPRLVREPYRDAMLLRKAPAAVVVRAARTLPGSLVLQRESTAGSAPVAPAGRAALAAVATTAPPQQRWADEARALAGQGRLDEALACCDRWIALEKLDAQAHYVRAAVLQEAGNPDAARLALGRALYIDGGFVLAHVALGQLELTAGNAELAARHFANAQDLLRGRAPAEELPDAEGMTVGQLTLTLSALAGATP